jgi:hypothetical protein
MEEQEERIVACCWCGWKDCPRKSSHFTEQLRAGCFYYSKEPDYEQLLSTLQRSPIPTTEEAKLIVTTTFRGNE